MALDLMLKSLVKSAEFNELSDKNWTSISKLIPGSSPKQCQRRYEELLNESNAASTASSNSLGLARSATSTGYSSRYLKADTDHRTSRPSSAKQSALKSENSETTIKAPSSRPVSGDHGPTMVIHVCDEVKNVKEDFNCPRDLLIKEMKYFAEYLSTDAQRWEEVDISVHCDVQIFDWLMKYVKRGTKEVPEPPKLEPINVISILISSDFLKMDTLVQECVEYCHKNMNAIIATPCNMNCINDKLVTRIADLFSHNEADDIRDRKDKFKSKIFVKKVEQLFSADANNNNSSLENAVTLYRCGVCKRVLTQNLEKKLRCMNSRISISKDGNISYTHVKDPAWDVNEYLLDLKANLKTWRDVYWRIWGTLNFLTCSRCGDVFQCADLGHCQYHAEPAQYDAVSKDPTKCAVGLHECCGQLTFKFDPVKTNKGCKVRDHVVMTAPRVDVKAGDSAVITEGGSTLSPAQQKVYDDLLTHREAVCVPYQRLVSHTERDCKVNVFAHETTKSGQVFPVLPEGSSTENQNKYEVPSKPRLEPLMMDVIEPEEYDFGESDDEVGDNEEPKARKRILKKSRRTVDPQAILMDAPDFRTTKNRKWDSSRSVRWNQDAQREEDQRRMNDIVGYLTKLRLHTEKQNKQPQKEFSGGFFCKLEYQWKMANAPPVKSTTNARIKPRLGQLR